MIVWITTGWDLSVDPPCGVTKVTKCGDGAGEDCYLDPHCLEPGSDPLGGLGCNAAGTGQACRFCGFGAFPPCLGGVDPMSAARAYEASLQVQLGKSIGCVYPDCIFSFEGRPVVAELMKDSSTRRKLQGALSVSLQATIEILNNTVTDSIEDKIHQIKEAASSGPALVPELDLAGVTSATLSASTAPTITLRSPNPPPVPPPALPAPSPPPPSPPPSTPPATPPPPLAPSCGMTLATAACTGNPAELCYLDPRCEFPATDPHGGLGCNAGGIKYTCRFCGFGIFSGIPCPGISVIAGEDGEGSPDDPSISALEGDGASALTSEDAGGAGGLTPIIAGASALLVVGGLIVLWRRRARKRLALEQKASHGSHGIEATKALGDRQIQKGASPRDDQLDADKQDIDMHAPWVRPSMQDGGHGSGKMEARLLEASQLREVLDGSVPLLEWSRVRFERMLEEGCMGKCYRVTLEEARDGVDDDDYVGEAGAEKLVLRRLGVDVLNCVSKLEWAEHVAEFNAAGLDHHPLFLHTMGLVTDGAHNFGVLAQSMPNSLDRVLMKAESSEQIAAKLRVGWPQLAREIAGGLGALHAAGLAHLSLHPGNVLLDGHTRVKLADYALPTSLIAKRRELFLAMEAPSGLVEEHQLYEAPELLRAEVGLAEDEALAPADIWSFGCIILRILTLEPLYSAAVASRPDSVTAFGKDGRSFLSQLLPRIAMGDLHPADNAEDAFHPWQPEEPAVPPMALALIRHCTDKDAFGRPSAPEVFESLGAQIQQELHHHKKGHHHHHHHPPEGAGTQVAAHSLPAPSRDVEPHSLPPPPPGYTDSAHGRRSGAVQSAMERASVREALGIDEASHAPSMDAMQAAMGRDSVREALGMPSPSMDAMQAAMQRDSVREALGMPSPRHALLQESISSGPSTPTPRADDVDNAGQDDLDEASVAAGRSLPTRLPPSRRRAGQARRQEPQRRMSVQPGSVSMPPRAMAQELDEGDLDDTGAEAEPMNAGVSVPGRTQRRRAPPRSAGAVVASATQDDEEPASGAGTEEPMNAGVCAPSRTQRRRAPPPSAGAAPVLETEDKEEPASNAGRAVATRLPTRRQRQEAEAGPASNAGRAVAPRLPTRQRQRQRPAASEEPVDESVANLHALSSLMAEENQDDDMFENAAEARARQMRRPPGALSSGNGSSSDHSRAEIPRGRSGLHVPDKQGSRLRI